MQKIDEKSHNPCKPIEEIPNSGSLSKSSSLGGKKIIKSQKENPILRIQGGGTFVRDVWDILAQAAEEIESLYENRFHNDSSNTREASNVNQTCEMSAPVSSYQSISEQNYSGSEVLSDEDDYPMTTRDTFNTCNGRRCVEDSSTNRNNTGTYYDTCPSIREFYERSLNRLESSKKLTNQPTTDLRTNPCKRNITFSSPITSTREFDCPQTYNIPNRSATFDPDSEFVSSKIGQECRARCLGNYSETPVGRNINERTFESSRRFDQFRCPQNETYNNSNQTNQNCRICSRSHGNQTFDIENQSHIPTNRTVSNGTFILNKTEVDDTAFEPHPALASTPKRGLKTPPFRNYTDSSMDYSKANQSCPSNSRSTNSSLPKVIRNDTKPSRIQRRVNETFENPKWTSSNQNKTLP